MLIINRENSEKKKFYFNHIVNLKYVLRFNLYLDHIHFFSKFGGQGLQVTSGILLVIDPLYDLSYLLLPLSHDLFLALQIGLEIRQYVL